MDNLDPPPRVGEYAASFWNATQVSGDTPMVIVHVLRWGFYFVIAMLERILAKPS